MKRRAPSGVIGKVPLRRSDRGGSGSFLLRADDRRRYWCKVLNNPQRPRVPVNDQIVARVGRLIGVAVGQPMLVRIPPELVGWEFRDGYKLEEGWAHGSLAVRPPVIETNELQHRGEDDNAIRHAGFLALHDWTAGSDPQWLRAEQQKNAYWSHDHGHYFPGGPDWTADTLNGAKDSEFPVPGGTAGMSAAELDRIAFELDGLKRDSIEDQLADLPTEWPASDVELEALIGFLDYRRAQVASRLRATAKGL